MGDEVDTVIVPKKLEVPIGRLRSILRQAHITLEDWEPSLGLFAETSKIKLVDIILAKQQRCPQDDIASLNLHFS